MLLRQRCRREAGAPGWGGTDPAGRRRVVALGAAAATTVLLWRLPWGTYAVYPFTILATWFHEMGHGIAAQILGGTFSKLEICSNGSGAAYYVLPAETGSSRRALIAAAGPLGPAIAGSLLIISARREAACRGALALLGTALMVSVLIWVRSMTGLIILPVMAVGICWCAARLPAALGSLVVQFLGVQACISVYKQLGYLFQREAVLGGQSMPSDTGQMAELLFLPHWFWGMCLAAVCFALFGWSLYQAARVSL